MKIGIISDIHSNIYAFKACTEYLEKQGCKEYIFLGDYISDTPYARETLDYLYEFVKMHTCHLLRGNREEYMLAQKEAREKNSTEQMWTSNSASGNLLYTYGQLVDKDFDFFQSLPITFVYEKEGYPSITCCHGSPANSRELLQLNEDPVKQWLEKIDTDYMICAHTHYPGEMTYKNKHYFNAGSVGISIDDAGYAQCMLLESGVENGTTIWKPQFLKVPYDNQKVAQDMITGGLLSIAPWFVNSNILTILTGIDCSAKMVELAEKLALEDNVQPKWPHIDEKYFEEAAEFYQIPDYRKESLLFSNQREADKGDVQNMQIRTATLADVDQIAAVEKECFPEAEAATEEEFEQRLSHYADHFWLMFEGEKLISFVDGMVTDEPNLTDEMYENATMHNENGAWQMIFGVNTIPEYRKHGYAGELLNRAIENARTQGRKGLVLTCKDRLIHYYAKFGFVNEGVSESVHGNVVWNQMRLTF